MQGKWGYLPGKQNDSYPPEKMPQKESSPPSASGNLEVCLWVAYSLLIQLLLFDLVSVCVDLANCKVHSVKIEAYNGDIFH